MAEKKDHRGEWDVHGVEGNAARHRSSSIPPSIQKRLESGTFPILRVPNINSDQGRIWILLEGKENLPEMLSQGISPQGEINPSNMALYLLADIDEYQLLPKKIKNMITNKLIRFIIQHTKKIDDPLQQKNQKYRLPSREILRQELFAQSFDAIHKLESYPATSPQQLKEINYWCYETILFEYPLYSTLPKDIKERITPSLVAFLKGQPDNCDDETIEENIILSTYESLRWLETRERIDRVLQKEIASWCDNMTHLAISPAYIKLIQRGVIEKIERILETIDAAK